MSAMVDDHDFEILSQHKWCLSRNVLVNWTKCYATRMCVTPEDKRQKQIYMHRVIVGAKDNEIVDHVNGNTLDNRRENLRIADRTSNTWNIVKVPTRGGKKTTSRFKGVSFDKICFSRPWKAQIHNNGKKITIGRFKEEVDAAIAYDEFAKKVRGEFAATNF